MEPKYEITVAGLGKIYVINAPFNEQLKVFRKNGIKPMSIKDKAYAMVHAPLESDVVQNGNRTSASVIYQVGKKPLFVKNLFLVSDSRLADAAVEAHRKGEEFIVPYENSRKIKTQMQKEISKRIAIEQRTVFELPNKEDFLISPMQNWDVARGIYENLADDYFSFLENNSGKNIESIKFITPSPGHIKEVKKPFLRQVWACGLVDDANLDSDDCGGRGLYYDYGLRGVLIGSAVGGDEKIKTYTLAQVIQQVKESCININMLKDYKINLIADLEARLK